MKLALPIPDVALFFERHGLPVFCAPIMSYRSAVMVQWDCLRTRSDGPCAPGFPSAPRVSSIGRLLGWSRHCRDHRHLRGRCWTALATKMSALLGLVKEDE